MTAVRVFILLGNADSERETHHSTEIPFDFHYSSARERLDSGTIVVLTPVQQVPVKRGLDLPAVVDLLPLESFSRLQDLKAISTPQPPRDHLLLRSLQQY